MMQHIKVKFVSRDEQSDVEPASALLREAAETIASRASERDNEETAERSMGATVNAFNALYGTNLTETQGWQFMVLLKMARGSQGQLNVDDYVDQAAYAGLAGECAQKSAMTTP